MKETISALARIQSKLKAPKDKSNDFGHYKYRSAESILASAKPLLLEENALLTLSDEVVNISGRFYVKATATFTGQDGDSIVTVAYAREDEAKKGMDGSQITGTASSYARKYALNGLFAIDDTKDADTDEYHMQTKQSKEESDRDMKTTRDTILGLVGGDMTGINLWIERNIEAGKMSEATTFEDLDRTQLGQLKVAIVRSLK